MGSNKNKNQPAQVGTDPKSQFQNTMATQTERFNNQQGPMVNAMAYNYGRGSEANYGDYTDIMNNYRDIASGGGNAGGSSGGGGGGGGGGGDSYSAFLVNPERVNAERANAQYANTERAAAARALGPLERVTAKDPFASYGGYQEFSQTGGYSPADISNMRARGMAPVRAAYANAERNVGQQRGLQGGYSPNAIAAQVKMAREQGQGMADAATNVEAGIAQARNAGRLAGYGGMAGIEGQRLGAQMQGDIFNAGQANEGQKFDIGNEMNTSQFNAGQGNQVGMFNAGQGNDVSMFNAGQGNDVGKFNANLNYQGQVYNSGENARAQSANNAAAQAGAARRAAAQQDDMDNRFRALGGMTNLYGTTPGMSNMFGNQLLQGVGQGASFGQGMVNAAIPGNQLPGQFDKTMGNINQIGNLVSQGAGAIYPWLNNNNQNQGGYNPYGQNNQVARPQVDYPVGPIDTGGWG